MADEAALSERTLSGEPAPPAMAFLLDRDSEGVIRRAFLDLGFTDARVQHGGIETAIETLRRNPPPRLLVVDVSGVEDPLMQMGRLADICDPSTEVVVVGDRNDIVLYRDLKALGVAEYLFKPLVSGLVMRACSATAAPSPQARGQRSGKLIIVIGVRGGVGATIMAANAAWYFAEVRQRRTLLLDLDLHGGDVALHVECTPSHALREALEHPDRVDDLFLERGVSQVTPRLGVLAALEPLADPIVIEEQSVLQLLDKLLFRYRYVFVDTSTETVLRLSQLLHLPSTVLLVCGGSLASARDAVRWRERLGPDSPERSTLLILNKAGRAGALPEKAFVKAVGKVPDVVIPYDRTIASGAAIGIKAMQKSAALGRGMASLCRLVAGRAADEVGGGRSLLSRIFRPWG